MRKQRKGIESKTACKQALTSAEGGLADRCRVTDSAVKGVCPTMSGWDNNKENQRGCMAARVMGRKGSMNKQQHHLLDMLKEIHEICVKNEITYYLAMGSLIGAVRHGGFLPWDDDADILMTRDEFERFKEACKTDLPPNRALCSSRTVESFGFLLPRYISTETTAIHPAQSLHEDVSGEVIDIFLLDPIADGDKTYENYVLDVNLYSEVVNYSNACSARFNLPRDVFDEYDKIRGEQGVMAASEALEKRLERNFDPNGHRYGFRWNGVAIPMERSWFAQTTLVDFEDTKLMAPVGINEFLTCYYGDEWTQIPAHITASKHDTAGSLEIPYAEALDYFEPAEDLSKLRDDMYERKRILLDTAPEQNALKDDDANARAALAKLELEKQLAATRPALDKAVAEHDGKTAAKILAPYITAQLSAALIGRHTYKGMPRIINPVLVDVEPRVFEAALLALMCTERISKASRLLEVWQQAGRQLTSSMEETTSLIERFRFATGCYARRKIEQGLEETELLLDELPRSLSFIKLRCVFLAARAESDPVAEHVDALAHAADEGLALEPEDGFFIKLQGDAARLRGDRTRARELYLKAAERTRNGYAIRGIFEQTGYHPSWYRTPDWALAYGVEQWNGEEVAAPEHTVVPGTGDACQQALFSLLKELCELCEKHHIAYILAPSTAKTLSQQKALPAKPADYAIVCAPKQALKLARALQHELGGDRVFGCCATNPAIEDCTLYYGDKSTLYLELEGTRPDPLGTLAVRVFVPHSQSKPAAPTFAGKLRAMLGKAGKTRSGNLESYRKKLEENAGLAGVVYAGAAKVKKLDLSKLAPETTLEYGGFSFRVPCDLKGYAAKTAGPIGTSLNPGKVNLASAAITLDELIAAGGFDKGYYRRKAALSLRLKPAKAINRRFAANFKSLKLAVSLKELSLELLPQKERICDLAQQHDIAGLKEILASYLKLAKKYRNAGNLEFDPEIYAALKLVQNDGK